MTGKEIIKAGKVTVRNSASLYPAYLSLFETAFGYKPECPTCGSVQGQRDWSKFQHFVENGETLTFEKPLQMENPTENFILRDKNQIYTYTYMHANGRLLSARRWGYAMDNAFAVAYLANSKDEAELQKRQAEFKVLPEEAKEDLVEVDLNSLTKDQLKERLTDLGVDTEDFKNLKKDELIALIEVTIIEVENDASMDPENSGSEIPVDEAEDLN